MAKQEVAQTTDGNMSLLWNFPVHQSHAFHNTWFKITLYTRRILFDAAWEIIQFIMFVTLRDIRVTKNLWSRRNIEHINNSILQELFCECVQAMIDDVTMQHRLSLAGCIHKIIPDIVEATQRNYSHSIMTTQMYHLVGLNNITTPLREHLAGVSLHFTSSTKVFAWYFIVANRSTTSHHVHWKGDGSTLAIYIAWPIRYHGQLAIYNHNTLGSSEKVMKYTYIVKKIMIGFGYYPNATSGLIWNHLICFQCPLILCCCLIFF